MAKIPPEHHLRHQIAAIAAKMYARHYIAGLSGNLSARLPGGNILVTPAGVDKSTLDPSQLLVVDLDGRLLTGQGGLEPTSELPMHLEVYSQRPDVGAVIHAHPITCVALSLVGISMEEPYLPEAILMLGPVPTAKYATPSTQENRQAIAGLIVGHNALILSHHGSLTLGRDLHEAYLRLEILEHTARTLALAHHLGKPRPLTQQQINKLMA